MKWCTWVLVDGATSPRGLYDLVAAMSGVLGESPDLGVPGALIRIMDLGGRRSLHALDEAWQALDLILPRSGDQCPVFASTRTTRPIEFLHKARRYRLTHGWKTGTVEMDTAYRHAWWTLTRLPMGEGRPEAEIPVGRPTGARSTWSGEYFCVRPIRLPLREGNFDDLFAEGGDLRKALPGALLLPPVSTTVPEDSYWADPWPKARAEARSLLADAWAGTDRPLALDLLDLVDDPFFRPQLLEGAVPTRLAGFIWPELESPPPSDVALLVTRASSPTAAYRRRFWSEQPALLEFFDPLGRCLPVDSPAATDDWRIDEEPLRPKESEYGPKDQAWDDYDAWLMPLTLGDLGPCRDRALAFPVERLDGKAACTQVANREVVHLFARPSVRDQHPKRWRQLLLHLARTLHRGDDESQLAWIRKYGRVGESGPGLGFTLETDERRLLLEHSERVRGEDVVEELSLALPAGWRILRRPSLLILDEPSCQLDEHGLLA